MRQHQSEQVDDGRHFYHNGAIPARARRYRTFARVVKANAAVTRNSVLKSPALRSRNGTASESPNLAAGVQTNCPNPNTYQPCFPTRRVLSQPVGGGFSGLAMGRRWWAGPGLDRAWPAGPTRQLFRWAPARPGPSNCQRMGRGPALPITFSKVHRPGPARPGQSFYQKSRPGPSHHMTVRPIRHSYGPAHVLSRTKRCMCIR